MAVKAKIFTNGRNQAVRIPQGMAFKGVDAVHIERDGKRLILTPVRNTWTSLSDLEPADEDFMRMRPRLMKSAGRER